MLIDANHPEETRVAVLDNTRLIELDFEVANKRPIKGNIYLAKVTRVEPSLQAAFVEYGNNKQGFLPFAEIHPDYFRIPVADREALIETEEVETVATTEEPLATDANGDPDVDAPAEAETIITRDDEDERRPRHNLKRIYKIQEVIKKRQILLVQVTKEERGNKGAALTTYLSLAGRYCVLMPNSHKGGGVSRKITDATERRRMKEIMSELELPQGIAVILRTAGIDRTKVEIKRDYEYLLRQWDEIRQLTLQSTAPALIYEEGDLIRRSLRDIYQRDTDEIWVEGEEGYKAAKAFMKMLIPSHAKKVQQYKDPVVPLFQRFQVERQIDGILKPVCPLPSGGYLVINQTEALVSIDVNSGKAIRERHIEETALRTNLEAADEVARQLRLRDLAGLLVIDFIDMEDRRNNQTVERRLKEALKTDRARIQVGRISGFGLLEMSRQRLRPALGEINTHVCEHCAGAGRVSSVEASALQLLRALEEEGLHNRSAEVKVSVPGTIALYLFNHKRAALTELEQRYHLHITMATDESLAPPYFKIETTLELTPEERTAFHTESHAAFLASRAESEEEERNRGRRRGSRTPQGRGGRGRERGEEEHETTFTPEREDDDIIGDSNVQFSDEERTASSPGDAAGEEERPGRRRRRRRGGRRNRGGDRRETGDLAAATPGETEMGASSTVSIEEAMGLVPADTDQAFERGDADGDADEGDKPARRRRRGGRRRSGRRGDAAPDMTTSEDTGEDSGDAAAEATDAPIAATDAKPAKQSLAAETVLVVAPPVAAPAAVYSTAPVEAPVTETPRPARQRPDPDPNVSVILDSPPEPKKGWWSRFVN
jgi:ribonuclease E